MNQTKARSSNWFEYSTNKVVFSCKQCSTLTCTETLHIRVLSWRITGMQVLSSRHALRPLEIWRWQYHFRNFKETTFSNMYLTATNPTVFQNLRKSIIVKFLQNSNRPNAQEIDHSSSWTCNSNNLYYWRSCTDWILRPALLKTFVLTMHMVQLGSNQEQESSTAKIGHRCSCDRRKQNAREENHLIETAEQHRPSAGLELLMFRVMQFRE